MEKRKKKAEREITNNWIVLRNIRIKRDNTRKSNLPQKFVFGIIKRDCTRVEARYSVTYIIFVRRDFGKDPLCDSHTKTMEDERRLREVT